MSREHLERPHLSGTMGKTDGGRRDPSRRKHKHLFCCLGVCGDSCTSERETEVTGRVGESSAEVYSRMRVLSLSLSLTCYKFYVYFLWLRTNIAISFAIALPRSLWLYLYFTLSRSSLSLSASSEDVDTFPSKIDNDRRV